MSKDRVNIGQSELECLQFVTEEGPISVGDVVRGFGEPRGLARTTISTMMERLRKKGHLERKKKGSVYLYAATVTKGQLMRDLIRDFVDTTWGGELTPFFAYLSEESKCTESELDELRTLVAQLESGEKDD
jgi:predicted transcriptional regulator